MIFAVFAPPMAAAPTVAGVPVFLWEMILDLIGLTAAIWSCWVLAWLDVEGALRGAFRYLTIGGVIFAILHLQDSLLRLGQALSSDWINLIHIGSMLLVMIFLVLGLARLADAALQEQPSATGIPPTRWWPLALSTALVLGALSFITYGLSLASAMLALFALHGSLVLLTVVCVVQVLRARLGGSVGRALGWGLLAVLIFSLVHPAQYLLSLANILGPTPYFALLHRIFVIPAFVLFCVSLSSLSRAWGTRQPEDASEALKAGRRKLELF